ncbi:MAG: hypothetical protein ACXWR1_03635 [Bdellovibrionota bacterium]
MTVRSFAISSILFLTTLAAHAGDAPCPDKGCGPNLPPIQQQPTPVQSGFCDGVYEGFLYSQPGTLRLEVQQVGPAGELSVTGYWGGNTWVGRGLCQQTSPCQAGLIFQFPNTPVQRAVLNTDPNSGAAQLDGQVDGGDAFRLVRKAQ